MCGGLETSGGAERMKLSAGELVARRCAPRRGISAPQLMRRAVGRARTGPPTLTSPVFELWLSGSLALRRCVPSRALRALPWPSGSPPPGPS